MIMLMNNVVLTITTICTYLHALTRLHILIVLTGVSNKSNELYFGE